MFEDEKERLSSYETIVLRNICRIAKSDDNIFSESELTRRKECWEIDIPSILKNLEKNNYIQRVKKGVWKTTRDGRRLSHSLENDYTYQRYKMKIVRK
jgi:hypothetical protein